MKQKIIGIIICSILFIPVLSVSSTANQDAILNIRTIDEGLLVGIAVSIENTGDVDADNVEWSIKFRSGNILFPIGGQKKGTFKSIPFGEMKSIFSGPVFGIGLFRPAEVTVTVSASNAETVEKTADVIIILFYTFVLQ
jgi:hypothetical protein